jgi:hypothetical protein
MANEADLVLDFQTDQERYILYEDELGEPIPVTVNLEASLFQGGETSGFINDTKTVGQPVDDAVVSVQITAPDSQQSVGFLTPVGEGRYTITLETTLLGNYDISVIASDNVAGSEYNNSEYVITTEHSFFISPDERPKQLTGQVYIQFALDELLAIENEYCPSRNECTLDNNTKKNLSNAISLISTALTYFDDGNHLDSKKGLNFYDKITDAVNRIYAYTDNPDFGANIDLTLEYLQTGSYLLALIVRDEAAVYDNCDLSNCEEVLASANSELGKAIQDSKQDNYVFIFNHLTNAWRFAMRVLGFNVKKAGTGNDVESLAIPTEFNVSQNYPNPFNPTTTINFQLPEQKFVSLKIYDVRGNLVTTLVSKEMEAGYHSVQWNAGKYASGVYFYRFTSGSFISTKRLLLLK